SHQSGFIAQSAPSIDELSHTVTGDEMGEDGKESLRALTYIALFAYAVGAIQEPNSEGSTGANRRVTITAQNHLSMNSATIKA
ncbi:MAG: hypothetical protein ACKPKO_52115, partial [Candidatus Fonsibacter sp.]